MGLREDSSTVRDNPPQPPAVVDVSRASATGTRRAAPYAARTRDYYRSLSASTVGLELAVSVILGMFLGRWLDGKAGTGPWLMILMLCLGFAAGLRSVWRFVLQADRDAARAEADAAADAQAGTAPAGEASSC
ncbi:MAG: AtpZ/AtpI family protein [Kofleriaceae bacterium]